MLDHFLPGIIETFDHCYLIGLISLIGSIGSFIKTRLPETCLITVHRFFGFIGPIGLIGLISFIGLISRISLIGPIG